MDARVEVPEIAVIVVDGMKKTNTHMCRGFSWWVQHLKFTFDLKVVVDMATLSLY